MKYYADFSGKLNDFEKTQIGLTKDLPLKRTYMLLIYIDSVLQYTLTTEKLYITIPGYNGLNLYYSEDKLIQAVDNAWVSKSAYPNANIYVTSDLKDAIHNIQNHKETTTILTSSKSSYEFIQKITLSSKNVTFGNDPDFLLIKTKYDTRRISKRIIRTI